MSISPVQEANNGQYGGLNSGLTVTVTLSSTAAGTLLVALASWGSSFTTWNGGTDSFTFPSGWVKVDGVGAGSNAYEELWYYPNNPGGITTVAITSTKPGAINNAETQYWIGEYSGAATAPLNHHAVNTGTSLSPSVSTSISDAAGDLVIAGFVWQTGTRTSFTVGSGYNAITVGDSNNVQQSQLHGEYEVDAVAQTHTANATLGVSESWKGVIATFSEKLTIGPTGIASAAAFGTASLGSPNWPINLDTSHNGIASAAAFGTLSIATLNKQVRCIGVPSKETFGALHVIGPPRTIAPVAIGSAVAFGALKVTYPQTVAPTGIASAAAFGSDTVILGKLVAPTGIASAEAFGTATLVEGQPRPRILSLSRHTIEVGVQTSVVLSGVSFVGATHVTFGPSDAVNFTVDSDTQITAVAPSNVAAGTYDVVVVTGNGSSPTSSVDQITYHVRPVITALSHSWNPFDGSLGLVITGTSLTDVNGIQICGIVQTVPAHTATTITLTTLAGVSHPYSGDVVLYVDDLQSNTGTQTKFEYQGNAQVRAVSPAQGSHSGGQAVLLSGVNFAGPQGDARVLSVRFGAANALVESNFTVQSESAILVHDTGWGGSAVYPLLIDVLLYADVAEVQPFPANPPNDTFTYQSSSTLYIVLAGIASSETFGTAAVTGGVQPAHIVPTGVVSGEGFGTARLGIQQNVVSAGIVTTEAFGTPAFTGGNVVQFIYPTGSPSFAAVGIPSVGNRNRILIPLGIVSTEAFGLSVLSLRNLTPPGLVSSEAFGILKIQNRNQKILPTGITSVEAFGRPILRRAVVIKPVGIGAPV